MASELTIGQIYLLDNVLVERELEVKDIKPRLLGLANHGLGEGHDSVRLPHRGDATAFQLAVQWIRGGVGSCCPSRVAG